jgi:CheY-like chemotaxis protein
MLRSPADARQVLVIEDNDDLREAFTEAVASAGHEVRAAADGPSGIALAGERPVDVAFVDIGLPGIDGFEVARRLRSQLGEDVVLVALTGFGREEDRELARAAGFDLHVTKPIDVERIDGIIRARAADAHR